MLSNQLSKLRIKKKRIKMLRLARVPPLRHPTGFLCGLLPQALMVTPKIRPTSSVPPALTRTSRKLPRCHSQRRLTASKMRVFTGLDGTRRSTRETCPSPATSCKFGSHQDGSLLISPSLLTISVSLRLIAMAGLQRRKASSFPMMIFRLPKAIQHPRPLA